jgi:aspartyl-tRNA(Asn)/glutamyl-tRNA(Gln) amidotransferase subunit A
VNGSSLLAIAAAVADGVVGAEEVVRDALEAAERSQASLNAFTSIDGDRALEAARAIDAARGAGDELGPLAGVPVAVKDIIDHAGRPNTRGSSAPAEIPAESAPAVSRLERAGAVVIGRTGLHEYAFGFSSENHWFGAVRNPWDPTLSPGGSSGGSGAVVSAGLVAGALGTDTGGSIRVPAALCGVVGLKVTHGRVPLRGVFPLAPSLDTVGPLARSVEDCAALYGVIAGDDPDDPWSVPVAVDPLTGPATLAGLSVGVPRPWVDRDVVAAQRAGFEALLSGLEDAGARVVELDISVLGPSPRVADSIYFEVAEVHRSRFAADPDQYGPEVRERLEAAFRVEGSAFLEALAWRRSLLAAALRAFAEVDVLATPSVAVLRKEIGVDTVELAGRARHYVSHLSAFTTVANHTGLPALAVPLPGDAAPPPSAQFIGPPWSETRLLAVGLALEHAGLSSVRRPPLWRPSGVGRIPGRDA